MYHGSRYDKLKWLVMWLLQASHLRVKDHCELFSEAGYRDIEIFEEHNKGWISAIAPNPAARRRNDGSTDDLTRCAWEQQAAN
jgi:hypothetical protein